MSQTSVIFFGLMVGFIVFITVRGELAAYLEVLGLSGNGGARTTAMPALPSLPSLPSLSTV